MGTNNPISMRFPFESQIAKLPPEIQMVHRTTWNAITDIYQSIGALNTKVEGVKSTASSTASTVENITNESETVVIQQGSASTGFVNNQTGNTTYTTQQSDSGSLIVLNDASPIAVTLSTAGTSPAIQVPWATRFSNEGSGAATLTPASGLVFSATAPSGAASYTLASGAIVSIYFDGSDFYI